MDISILFGIILGLFLPLTVLASPKGLRIGLLLPSLVIGIRVNIWTGFLPDYTLFVAVALMGAILFIPIGNGEPNE